MTVPAELFMCRGLGAITISDPRASRTRAPGAVDTAKAKREGEHSRRSCLRARTSVIAYRS
jgi:hypothetical protein